MNFLTGLLTSGSDLAATGFGHASRMLETPSQAKSRLSAIEELSSFKSYGTVGLVASIALIIFGTLLLGSVPVLGCFLIIFGAVSALAFRDIQQVLANVSEIFEDAGVHGRFMKNSDNKVNQLVKNTWFIKPWFSDSLKKEIESRS